MRDDPPIRRVQSTGGRARSPTPLDIDAGTLPADAVTVDVLARLQVAAQRAGARIRVRHASAELHDLIVFMGLAEQLLG